MRLPDGVRLPGANTDAADDCGRTALHVAAENDMLREAMMLVKNGARVDNRDRRGRTPFELASDDVRCASSARGVRASAARRRS